MRHGKRGGSSRVLSLIGSTIVVVLLGAYLYQIESGRPGTSSSSSSTSLSRTPLIVYAADAYVQEVVALEDSFSASTGIPTAPPKAGGSLVLAQQIAQGSPVSVFFSVSRLAVEPPYLKEQAPGWAIAFAADQMSIAYSNSSNNDPSVQAILTDYYRANADNTSQSWYALFSDLTGGSVRVGISNPNTDPAGYRGWLVLEAAGGRYANRSDFFSNRLLKAEANVTGFSAAELIAPLESGQIQFLLIYKSACISHGLNFIQLPKSVNLGDAGYSGFYSRFDYKLARGPVKGAPVLLFVTVPVDCVDCGDSVKLVSYVVKNSGSLSRFELQILNPSKLYNNTEVPPLISDLLSEGLLESSGPP